MNYISSKDNSLVKHIQKLQINSSYRHKNKQAIISGQNIVLEAAENNILLQVFIDEKKIIKYDTLIKNLTVEIFSVSSKVIEKINILDGYCDIFAVIKFVDNQLTQVTYQEDCILLDNIQDPGNVGTMIRSASAAGIKNIILSNNSVDIYNPKVLRATQGALFKVKLYINIDLFLFIKSYKQNIIATVVTNAENLFKVNLSQVNAWVFGNEGNGVSQDILSLIECKICIPMLNKTESLNVAMSATICFFEQLRQRTM